MEDPLCASESREKTYWESQEKVSVRKTKEKPHVSLEQTVVHLGSFRSGSDGETVGYRQAVTRPTFLPQQSCNIEQTDTTQGAIYVAAIVM